jgi:hypothetical protein
VPQVAAAAAGSAFMSHSVSLSGGLAPVRTHPAAAAAVSTPSPVASLGAWGQQQQQQQGIGPSRPTVHTPGRPAGSSSSSSLQGSTPPAVATTATACSAVAGDLISLDSLNLDSQQGQGQGHAGDGGLQEGQLLQLPVSSSAHGAGFTAAGGMPTSQYNPFAAASAAAAAAGAGSSPAR